MYRHIAPEDKRQLKFRMLFHPIGNGLFLRAAEADSFRGLVAAVLDDAAYENSDVETRIVNRLRLADEIVLLIQVEAQPTAHIADREAERTINIATDETFIRSLHRLGFVSLDPALSDAHL